MMLLDPTRHSIYVAESIFFFFVFSYKLIFLRFGKMGEEKEEEGDGWLWCLSSRRRVSEEKGGRIAANLQKTPNRRSQPRVSQCNLDLLLFLGLSPSAKSFSLFELSLSHPYVCAMAVMRKRHRWEAE